jgi:uncharacterized protein (DUF1015 family)
MDLEKVALGLPEILLPKKGTDLARWAVVACDQYTSQPEVWEEIRKTAGDYPSTLNIIYPEVYLEEEDAENRIKSINGYMEKYLADGTLEAQKPGFVLVDRKTSQAPSRKGLVVALDLDNYDFSAGSKTMIRATEGTVIDRLPPRIKIRKNAAIESPHIMVLIDDPNKTVIEPLFKKNLTKLYDFELMMDCGHIKGWAVDDEESLNQVALALAKLAEAGNYMKKYGVNDGSVMLYAMGDGNHSLATAKSIWEAMKKETKDKSSLAGHPARYALVELVNIHDPGLEFEPIHRVLFSADKDDLIGKLKAYCETEGSTVTIAAADSPKELCQKPASRSDVHLIPFVADGSCGTIKIEKPSRQLEYATLQTFLDNYLKDNPATKIDYVHGEKIVEELGSKPGNMGFFLPVIPKKTFFKTIIIDGVLPRKTFSMGHADEKRFYLECRKIK